MVDFQYKDSYGVKDLEEIVRLLRAPGGCPWDAEQTHQSIRRNFLEEAYEAVEAIDEGSPEHLKEELGDVLLQVVFHALMEQEAGRFDLDAVADGTNVEEELGDLLFSAVNVSRFVKVDTEEALNRATDKFIGRFRKVEEEAARQGRALEGMSLAELDKLWEHAKET